MGKKKKRIRELEEQIAELEIRLKESYGLSIEPPAPRTVGGGPHPPGVSHTIEAIGRAPGKQIYFCGCGEKLEFEAQKSMVNTEGGPGLVEKFGFNPFKGPGGLPPGWKLGEELRQLDTDTL